ncbi:MAG: P-loop NTPase [Chloroflexi bacterium]|nr:P-loop NTPase [Chloroflexota bacterium]
MKIVVASGKGGTGKTLVATSLALVASEDSVTAFLDADVEAPNAALFLHPRLEEHLLVERLVPEIDANRCNHCGRCAEVCQYNALAVLPNQTLVFSEVCHSCGSCARQCPQGAIREVPQAIGSLDVGWVDTSLSFVQGTLEIGQAIATPVIRAVKRHAREAGWDRFSVNIVDAPPGTACPMVESLRGASVVLLVTEPTSFGLHDLRLAIEVARDMLSLPVAVAINKERSDNTMMDDFCRAEQIPVVLRIPLDRRIAVAYSQGIPLVQALPEYRPKLAEVLQNLRRIATEDRT